MFNDRRRPLHVSQYKCSARRAIQSAEQPPRPRFRSRSRSEGDLQAPGSQGSSGAVRTASTAPATWHSRQWPAGSGRRRRMFDPGSGCEHARWRGLGQAPAHSAHGRHALKQTTRRTLGAALLSAATFEEITHSTRGELTARDIQDKEPALQKARLLSEAHIGLLQAIETVRHHIRTKMAVHHATAEIMARPQLPRAGVRILGEGAMPKTPRRQNERGVREHPREDGPNRSQRVIRECFPVSCKLAKVTGGERIQDELHLVVAGAVAQGVEYVIQAVAGRRRRRKVR